MYEYIHSIHKKILMVHTVTPMINNTYILKFCLIFLRKLMTTVIFCLIKATLIRTDFSD